jgi:hypothetical protein
MKLTRLWTVGCLLLLTLTQAARAQNFVPLHGEGVSFAMTPVGGEGYADPQFFAAGTAATARATVDGRSTSELGKIEIGFDYLRPFWDHRDFILAVPPANAGDFPLLGDIGHVDNHFALRPNVKFGYNVTNELSVKADGTFLNLTGHFERTVGPATAQGNLNANSSLTIVTATFPEITARFYYDELFSHGTHLDNLVIDLGLGTRFASINQDYTGSLSNVSAAGRNETTRFSHQDFKGIGLTSSLNFTLPVHPAWDDNDLRVVPAWDLYTNLRGSILVGDNRKNSSLAVTVAGVPGVSNSIEQDETEFIPVAEIETGVAWTRAFGAVRTDLSALFTVRVGLSAQIWGNVGPLSAGSPQGFQTSNLYLVGCHVMVGFIR